MNETAIAEYLYITWDGDPPYEVVRGHVGDADARSIVDSEGMADEDYPWESIRHDYARWVPDATGEYDMRFELAGGRGRGAFPVTLLYYY